MPNCLFCLKAEGGQGVNNYKSTSSMSTFCVEKPAAGSKLFQWNRSITEEDKVPWLLKLICILFEVDFDSIFNDNEAKMTISLCPLCLNVFNTLYTLQFQLSSLLDSIRKTLQYSMFLSSSRQFGGTPANAENCRRFRRQICAQIAAAGSSKEGDAATTATASNSSVGVINNFNAAASKIYPRAAAAAMPVDVKEASLQANTPRKQVITGQDVVDGSFPTEEIKVKVEAFPPNEDERDPLALEEENSEIKQENDDDMSEDLNNSPVMSPSSFIITPDVPTTREQIKTRKRKKAFPFNCTICKKAFISAEENEHHQYLHSLGDFQKFATCRFCSHCRSKDALNIRLHEIHCHSDRLVFQCQECPEKYGIDFLLKIHQQTHLDQKSFRCSVCERDFDKSATLQDHLMYIHLPRNNSTIVTCKHCDQVFPCERLAAHIKSKHETPVVNVCEFCDKEFTNIDFFTLHLINVHECEYREKTLKCSTCDKTFASKVILERHEKLHEKYKIALDSVPFLCEICDLRYKSQDKLESHMLNSHKKCDKPLPEFVCKECSVKYGNRQSLIRHQTLNHPQLLVHACDQCDKKYTLDTFLEIHKKTHGKPDKDGFYKCTCKQGNFKTADGLAKHLQTHCGEDRFTCNFCSAPFHVKYALKKHLRTKHPKEIIPDFKCIPCNKTYQTKFQLNEHLKSYHPTEDSEKFPCDQCKKICYTPRSLRRHVKSCHTKAAEPQQEQCHVCGVSVSHMSNHVMRRHPEIAKTEKKCHCYFCGKCFFNLFELTQHMYIHTLERPFICSCGKDFTQAHCLTSHKKRCHKSESAASSSSPLNAKKRKENLKSAAASSEPKSNPGNGTVPNFYPHPLTSTSYSNQHSGFGPQNAPAHYQQYQNYQPWNYSQFSQQSQLYPIPMDFTAPVDMNFDMLK